jgi:hypothetical protein
VYNLGAPEGKMEIPARLGQSIENKFYRGVTKSIPLVVVLMMDSLVAAIPQIWLESLD